MVAALSLPQEQWPDWSGKAVAIVASGPSVKRDEVASLQGRLPVLAIKENVDLAPWAEMVYGCDAPFWVNRKGLPDFHGIKVAFAKSLHPKHPDIRLVTIDVRKEELLFGQFGLIGSGGNSGFQALNIAVQLGAAKILLVGFDVGGSKVHWYGRNIGNGRTNPNEQNFKRWRAAYNRAAMQLKDRGIDVVNASPTTTLECFRRAGIAETLAAWGL